ncbi:MAG: NUDIX domain-containing protein [Mariprofundales bacterium]|nr:NUDIX domain-containing protein [Mariprofundales bacterium]
MKYTLHDQVPLHQGRFTLQELELSHDRFGGGQLRIKRELFERGDAVGVLLYDSAIDTVLLLEQFRIGPVARGDTPWLIEIVAGIIDDGESAAEAARREALEEAGYLPQQLHTLGQRWYPSPGACSERITLFAAEVDSSQPQGKGGGVAEEAEDIRRRWVPRHEALAMVADGRINSALPMLALLLAFGCAGSIANDSLRR